MVEVAFFFRGSEGHMGFSRHGVVVRLDATLFGVSLPSLAILHVSAPGAWCALEEGEKDPGWIA